MFNNSQASLLHISCCGLLQKKQKGTRGPCSSGGHPAPEVMPCHLKLPLNHPLLALASHKQHSSSPAANGPAIFDTCLPLMHAGQGCFWILCFSPDESVRLFSYLFSKLLLDTTLSWNISSNKMLILYFITVANRILNTFFYCCNTYVKVHAPSFSILANITYTLQYSLKLWAMQILCCLVTLSLFNILNFCFFSRLIWNYI